MFNDKWNWIIVSSARASVFEILYADWDCEQIPSCMAPDLTFEAKSRVLRGEICCYLNWRHPTEKWLPLNNL